VLIVNKTDLVAPAELLTIEQTLKELNPSAQVVHAKYGVVESVLNEATILSKATLPIESEEEEHHHDETLGLETWSPRITGVFDESALRALLQMVVRGEYGNVLRAKGLLPVRRGWVRFDVAGGQVSVAAFAPQGEEVARAVVIGRGLQPSKIQEGFDDSRVPSVEPRLAVANG
jgi:G3E family GTPase